MDGYEVNGEEKHDGGCCLEGWNLRATCFGRGTSGIC